MLPEFLYHASATLWKGFYNILETPFIFKTISKHSFCELANFNIKTLVLTWFYTEKSTCKAENTQRFSGTESRQVLLKCGERGGEWQGIRLEGRAEAQRPW